MHAGQGFTLPCIIFVNIKVSIFVVCDFVIPVYPESFFFNNWKRKDSRQAGMSYRLTIKHENE
jgi:hypothetical protein